MMKEELGESGPKGVIACVSKKVGGILGADAPGQLLRDEKQVTNTKRALKFQENQGEELYVIMQKAKTGDDFVRDIKILLWY